MPEKRALYVYHDQISPNLESAYLLFARTGITLWQTKILQLPTELASAKQSNINILTVLYDPSFMIPYLEENDATTYLMTLVNGMVSGISVQKLDLSDSSSVMNIATALMLASS